MTDRGLFEPDVLIREHFLAARRRRAATLEREALDAGRFGECARLLPEVHFRDRPRRPRAVRRKPRSGSRARATKTSFSFENISETLDINPEYLRRGLAAWRQRLLEAHRRTVETATAESLHLDRVAS